MLIRAVPVCDDHMLKIEWPITPGIHHYKEIPSRYLDHLIDHEGEGSLFHILKKLGMFLKPLYCSDNIERIHLYISD